MPDYKVTIGNEPPMPVRANNKQAARNHAVRELVKVETLTIEDAMKFGRDDVALQIVGDEPSEAGEGEE